MTSSKILDSHIHLWPSTAVSPTNHGWMTPGLSLAKRHGIDDYRAATASATVQPSGFIYVETDRYLPGPYPDLNADDVSAIAVTSEARESAIEKLRAWAHEPLEELRYLRRIVEGQPEAGDGFHSQDSGRMAGCVIWAPFHLPTALFELYLEIAEDVCGPQLWGKVVGFRYLLQHVKSEETLRQTLEKPSWRQNILRLGSGRGGKGWTFDVGIDTHSTGPWQIDVFADMIEKVRSSEDKNEGSGNRVRFILNHLCKPDLSAPSPSSFPAWRAAIQRMAGLPDVYMKFSGCLNEFYPSSTPSSVDGLLERLDGCARCVFEVFGQSRIMFGSDWPVCNIGGPLQENGNWELWRSVVETVVEKYCGEDVGEAKMDVFSRTGCRVYGVEV